MVPGVSELSLPKLPLLDEETTRQLILQAQNGSKEAKDKLVQHNLRLVMSIVIRFSGRGRKRKIFFRWAA